jgi:hypothetical protein
MATKKPVMQGGGPNYLGKQKMVTAPKKWKSSPTHPEAHLAYITDAEQDLLIKKDLYGSLKGKPNRGPSGIVSLQGDLGGYSGGQGGGKSGGGEGKGGGDSRSTPWRDTQQYKVLTRGQYNPDTQSFKDDRIARGARGAWSSPHLNPDAQQFGFDAKQINKRRGIGGLLGALGRGALSIFGGIPGKIMSGIMTAKNWAGDQGSNLWSGVKDFGAGVREFGEHDNLMSYLNRNKVQAINPVETMPTNQEIIGERIGEYWRQPSNVMPNNLTNNMGVNNQMIDPNFLAPGAKDGGRIGYKWGELVDENIKGPGFDENIEMASAVDPMDALNDMSMEIFNGRQLHELTPEEYQMLIDMANEQAMGEQDQGIASLV